MNPTNKIPVKKINFLRNIKNNKDSFCQKNNLEDIYVTQKDNYIKTGFKSIMKKFKHEELCY